MDKTSYRVLTLTVSCMLFLSTTAQQVIAWDCPPPRPDCHTCTETGWEYNCGGGESCCDDTCCNTSTQKCCDDIGGDDDGYCCGSDETCCGGDCCATGQCCYSGSCEDLPDCDEYTLFSGELTTVQTLLEDALGLIPCVTVSNVSVGGSISGELCPCCGNEGIITLGTVEGNGSANVSATLTGNIPLLSWEFDFDYKGFGVYGTAIFSPQLIASPEISGSIDVFKVLNDECDGDDCLTVDGCAGVSVELALHAEVTAGMHFGWWDIELTMMAHAGVTASAAAWVEYASPQCIPPGTTTDACLGDVVGVIEVDILGWEWESDPYTFYDGDDDCGCS